MSIPAQFEWQRPLFRWRKLVFLLAIALFGFGARPLVAQSSPAHLDVPKETGEGLEILYAGDPDKAIEIFKRVQTSQPDSPLGYLLEAEARWWKLYCWSLEFKWGHLDAWHREEAREDAPFLRLADKAVALAEAQLKAKANRGDAPLRRNGVCASSEADGAA